MIVLQCVGSITQLFCRYRVLFGGGISGVCKLHMAWSLEPRAVESTPKMVHCCILFSTKTILVSEVMFWTTCALRADGPYMWGACSNDEAVVMVRLTTPVAVGVTPRLVQ